MQQRNVLAIDGGGIRGIIPALILSHIERRAGRPIAELFDLVVGTSTGGILALGLSMPDPLARDGSQYTARELVEFYKQRGPQIFDPSLWRSLRSVSGVLDESYSAETLERVLEGYFKTRTLAECRVPTMVTTYAIERREAVFLKSFNPDHKAIRCVDAARATTAAPTFFEPASVRIAGEPHALIDGGVYINAPAVSAYAEAIALYPDSDINVVSIGTGHLTRPIPLERAVEWGAAGWLAPLLDCMFDGVAKVTDQQMRLLLGDGYYRFQLSLDSANDEMDDASEANLAALEAAALELIEREEQKLDRVIARLLSD